MWSRHQALGKQRPSSPPIGIGERHLPRHGGFDDGNQLLGRVFVALGVGMGVVAHAIFRHPGGRLRIDEVDAGISRGG